MMWLTWRRYRVRIILLSLYAFALVIFMIMTVHAFQTVDANCSHHVITGPSGCGAAASRVGEHDSLITLGIVTMPLFLGLVLGVPLVASEIEAKTNRLAWSQGITRTRWLLTSWLTLALASVAIMSLLETVVQWWANHVYGIVIAGRGTSIPTGLTGFTPVVIAVFALSFGACLGAVLRSTVLAVAGSFVGFLVILTAISTTETGPQGISQLGVTGIYLILVATCLGLTLMAVRRWRA